MDKADVEQSSSPCRATSFPVTFAANASLASPQPVLDDCLDPLNWRKGQKNFILAIVMGLYFMFTYITTTTVPSGPKLQVRYGITVEQVSWTTALPALGLALGPLLSSSVAEVFGRRVVMMGGTTVALASTIGAALSPTYATYLIARVFQGLGISPAATIGLAIINDLFLESERGEKTGLWVLAVDLGLLVGPIIGGFIDLAGDVWVQWHIAMIFGVLLGLQAFFLPETLYPRDYMSSQTQNLSSPLDQKEGTALGVLPGPTALPRRTKQLPFINVAPVPGLERLSLHRSISELFDVLKHFTVPISIATYCFGWYWWIMCVITMVPTAYTEFSAQIQQLFFIGLIIGTLAAELFISGRQSDRLVAHLTKYKSGKAEMRLWFAYPGAILSAIGLVVWSVSVDRKWHWITGQIGLALFGGGLQMGNTAICSYMTDACPQRRMAVTVLYAFLLNISAFASPFFIVQWIERAGFTWTFTCQALIIVFFCMPLLALVHGFGGEVMTGRWRSYSRESN